MEIRLSSHQSEGILLDGFPREIHLEIHDNVFPSPIRSTLRLMWTLSGGRCQEFFEIIKKGVDIIDTQQSMAECIHLETKDIQSMLEQL